MSPYGRGSILPAGESSFEYQWVRFTFAADGAYSGTNGVRGQITLDEDGNGYTSISVSETLNLEGKVLASTQNTSRATRMVIAPVA